MWERCCSNASKSSELICTTRLGPVQISLLDLLALPHHRSHIQCKLVQHVRVYNVAISFYLQWSHEATQNWVNVAGVNASHSVSSGSYGDICCNCGYCLGRKLDAAPNTSSHHGICSIVAGPVSMYLSCPKQPVSMNYMKLAIPLHSLHWSIHTKDESKHGTAFAFTFGVNWLWRWGVTASFGVYFHEI